MAIYIRPLFLVAADLTFASIVSCVLYVLACLCFGSLIGFVIFLSSFGVVKRVKRNIGQKGSAIVGLVSKNTIGGMLVGNLDRAGFGVMAERGGSPILKKECSSNTMVAQLPVAEEKYRKVMQTPTKKQLYLKGMSGVMKKPSVMKWGEETESPKVYDRKAPPEKKKGFLTPAFLIALLWAPVKIMCPCLKKLLTTQLKSQD